MFDPVNFISGFVSGGTMGAVIAHFLTRDREAQLRRRKFRDTINTIAAGLDAHSNKGLSRAYSDTRDTVRSECARVLEDIRWWRKSRFQSAAESYLALTQQQTDPGADPKHMTEAFTVAQRGQRFDAARAMIVGCLHRIVRYAR